MTRRREFNVFSLSFLDVMSCGFGAVILIYIVINHSTEITSQALNVQLMAEVKKLEEEINTDSENLAQIKNVFEETRDEVITTEGMALEIKETIKNLRAQIGKLNQSGNSQQDSIEKLISELKTLEEESASLEGSVGASEASGSSLRSVVGEGDRQYLTGLRIGGQNILILVDASASMLDETIVNVIRLKNMSDQNKRQAEKWQRAVRTVEWIIANIPRDSQFQAYSFNTSSKTLVQGKENIWLDAINREHTDLALTSLKELIPDKGTSLHTAFSVAVNLDPRPDNIFLIVDGLPTQGPIAPKSTIVSSKDRVLHFANSLQALPQGIPVNIILFPMEGDPLSTSTYWRLAQMTGGSFLSPPRDWP